MMTNRCRPVVSDDEVVRALIRESKLREGKLPAEATRLKPNLFFLQRTVSNLVSANTRINRRKNQFIAENISNPKFKHTERLPPTKSIKHNTRTNLKKEKICIPKINFIKSQQEFKSVTNPKDKYDKSKYHSNFVKSTEILYNTTNSDLNTQLNISKHVPGSTISKKLKAAYLEKNFVKSDVLYSTTNAAAGTCHLNNKYIVKPADIECISYNNSELSKNKATSKADVSSCNSISCVIEINSESSDDEIKKKVKRRKKKHKKKLKQKS